MRTTSFLPLLAAVLMAVPAGAQAQGNGSSRPPAASRDSNSDEAAIHRWVDRWAKAFRAHDLDGIMALYAPEVVAYDVVPPLQFSGREAYRKDYSEFLAQYDGPIDLEIRELRILVDGNLAYAAGLERIGGVLKDGQRSDVWVRFTSIFRRRGGRWLDIHDHVSVPADFGTGKAVLDLKP